MRWRHVTCPNSRHADTRTVEYGTPLADAFGKENVDGGVAASPPVLAPVGGDACRAETDVLQCLGERAQERRVRPYVDDGVSVVRRTRREPAALRAVQMYELPADQRPMGGQRLLQLEKG